ncbi:hypothetical protein JDV02_010701 [Purpureocillium takamizusanense]|uniref:Cuticle-degrading protease n=1 Tax=Purpureocillium takamizusanense TaxID=2060973 RepID=A0A9Q8QSI3_9HYPO|nr:uncharacterized protein JDV02_010701 [Purpureocillium takamizusanense]UNI24990.1 hypothetical protein JDV02_010701 [Purpureocillium takamizusanense]
MLLTALTFLAVSLAQATVPYRRASPAPLIQPRGANLVDNTYIVKIKDGASTDSVDGFLSNRSISSVYTYYNALSGFTAVLTAEQLSSLRDHNDVEYVEQDAVVHLDRPKWILSHETEQKNAPWGLARISSLKPGSSTYIFDASSGAGTCSYVVDTGIDITHPDFEGRASFLINTFDNETTDTSGHGTHVAGIIGSRTYGVAKNTTLLGVRVTDDDNGRISAAIAGLDFIYSDAISRACPNGRIVNMSVGYPRSAALNAAASRLVRAGIFVAAGAGNSGEIVSTSPQTEPSVCTVGATAKNDSFASFSNYGPLVSVLAPGVKISSTFLNHTVAVANGTSMASPHVAGLAAYFLGMNMSATGLCQYLAATSISGAIARVPEGTANKLVNNGHR